MKKGRYQKAFAAFSRIRNTELIAAREMYYAHCMLMAEEVAFEGKSLATRVWELFSIPRIRRASVASAIIVISQQFSGINIMVLLLSPDAIDSSINTVSRPFTRPQSSRRLDILPHSPF